MNPSVACVSVIVLTFLFGHASPKSGFRHQFSGFLTTIWLASIVRGLLWQPLPIETVQEI